MITLILPGYSQHNKSWAEEAARIIDVGGQIRPIFWDHWTDPEKPFEPKEKARLLADLSIENTINIVAKSIGTLVASYIVQRGPGKIRKLVFCGIPLNDMSEKHIEEIRNTLRDFPPEKIICFQNEEDPHGTFDQAKSFYEEINSKIKVVSKDRGDHEYPYYEEFNKFLQT